jgi:O-antigen/teichoic acid export membrane protein
MKGSPLLHNTTLASLGAIGQGIANLITVVYLARVLHPTRYGVFSYTWAIIGILGILTSLGLPTLLTRQLSRADDRTPALGYGLSMLGLLSVLVTIMFVAAVQVIPGLYRYHMVFDLWALLVLVNGINPRWVYTGLQQLWVSSVGDTATSVTRLALTVWLVHGPADLRRAVAITVLATALPVAGEMIWLRRHVRFRWQWISLHDGWSAIRQALPLGVTSFVSILYSGIDTWILHVYVGSRAVGIYSAAYRPVIFLTTFSGIYFNLTYPILSRLTLRDRPLTQRVIQLSGIAVLALVLPMGIGTDVVANALMRQAFGTTYVASGLVLSVLIWSWGLGIVRDTFSTPLVAGNQEVVFARVFGIAGVINAGLMFYVVRWGPVGTASALVITQALLLIFCVVAVRRLVPHPINLKTDGVYVLKIGVNSLVMGACVWLIRPHVSVELAILAGIVVYAGLTWITRSVPWQEVWDTIHMAP